VAGLAWPERSVSSFVFNCLPQENRLGPEPKADNPLVLGLLLITGLLTGLNLVTQQSLSEDAEQHRLWNLRADFQERLANETNTAFVLAGTIANDPLVQQALSLRNRQLLVDLLRLRYCGFDRQLGIHSAQFNLTDSTSFLRLDDPTRFGDDLSALRKTVVEANWDHHPHDRGSSPASGRAESRSAV